MLLNDLQATGVLQPKNRMDIEALLNPAEESWMMDGMTDEGICQAVLVARDAQEEGPIMVGMMTLRMMHHLNPAQHIVRCCKQHQSSIGMLGISTIPLHASLRQFWPLLDVQIRLEEFKSMTSTHLTDYFTRM